MDLIQLVAPNTSAERMREIDRQSSGFVYCVSVTGVTGAREAEEVSKSVDRFIDRVIENVALNPKMIGFGIKNHENAMQVSKRVDGFIVGSALVEQIRATAMADGHANHAENGQPVADSVETMSSGDWKEELFRFVRHLKFGD
jgi:tryptophan synthase alpha chain